MSVEHTLVGPNWHTSYEKRVLDATLAKNTRVLAYWITRNVLLTLSSNIFEQERVGLGGHLFKMLKVQTMHAPDIALHAKKELTPTAIAIRKLALDELVQIAHVSEDPSQPGSMSIIGPRPQLPEELESMYKAMHATGEAERFYKWVDMYTSMRPGIFGVDSLIGEAFEPGSYELYDARIQATEWYYHNASQAVDLTILGTVMAYGAKHLQITLPEVIAAEIDLHNGELTY